jgi:hydrogenase/urease accessory protein HupE
MSYVVVLEAFQFPRPVDELALHTDLFGTGDGEAKLSIRATRDQLHGADAELAILDPLVRTHVFFRGLLSTFAQSVELGVEHILTGPDHLLFLLTIVMGAAGWRYWLSVITSFTVSHSITLSLSVSGVLHAPARLVEPAIAASIVLMALHQLLHAGTPLGRWRIALVFACGLLHGMGLASALGDIGLDRAHRLGTLAGFNLGVELGQFIFSCRGSRARSAGPSVPTGERRGAVATPAGRHRGGTRHDHAGAATRVAARSTARSHSSGHGAETGNFVLDRSEAELGFLRDFFGKLEAYAGPTVAQFLRFPAQPSW